MEHYSFSGKRMLVTGATGGLGSALVSGLAALGASVVATSRSHSALEELRSRLPESTHMETVIADLSVPGDADRLAHEAVERMGAIDVVFNNAGIGYFALMEESTEENLRHLFEVNAFAPIRLVQALIPHMKSRGGGRVVNIVSAAGQGAHSHGRNLRREQVRTGGDGQHHAARARTRGHRCHKHISWDHRLCVRTECVAGREQVGNVSHGSLRGSET